MKKYIGGLMAVIFAIAASAFNAPQRGSSLDPSFDWQVYDASGNPTSTYVLNKTKAEMQHDNPNCNANTTICFRAWNLGHTQPQNIYLKKQ